MLHPSLHGYLVDQHQRELERAAKHERLLAEIRQATSDTPSAAERTTRNAGRLLIGLGQRLCARYPSEAQRIMPWTASHEGVLSPLSAWAPAMLARVSDGMEGRPPTVMTFVYYGFVTVGPRGISRAEYVTPLMCPSTNGRLGVGK